MPLFVTIETSLQTVNFCTNALKKVYALLNKIFPQLDHINFAKLLELYSLLIYQYKI